MPVRVSHVCVSHVCVSKMCVCVYTVASCARDLPKKPIYMKRDLHKRPTSHKFIQSNFRHARYLLGSMYVCVCVCVVHVFVRTRARAHTCSCVCVCMCVCVCVFVCVFLRCVCGSTLKALQSCLRSTKSCRKIRAPPGCTNESHHSNM